MSRKRTGYLIRRGRIFYAVWKVAGKKFVKSTGKGDRRDAETELHKIMEPFVAGNEVTVLQNIAAKIEGRQGDIDRWELEKNPPLRINEAWNTYEQSPMRPDTGPATLEKYSIQFDQFCRWLKEAHNEVMFVKDVKPEIAQEYATCLLNRKITANTFNKHIRTLHLVFRILKDKARMQDNPWATIPRKKNITQGRRELTEDELRKVCGRAKGEMKLLFALGIYTGLRLGDCCTLKWEEVNLSTNLPLIKRIPNKIARRPNVKHVVIPIHPVLVNLLEQARPKQGSGFVLPGWAAAYSERHSSFVSDQIQRHFEDCGIRTVNPDKKGRLISQVEVSFYSLRHSFVSLCRGSNAPLAVVEAIVGHANPAMTRHYTHVSELAAATAVNCLPSVMGEKIKALPPKADTFSKESVRELVETLTGKNWKQVKIELLAKLA